MQNWEFPITSRLVCHEIERLDPAQIEKVSELIEAAYDDGRFVFIIGNGGSGANASHLCEDLAKCTLRDFENQKRLKVLSLTDNTAGIMAWANDEGYDRIFVEQLKNLASPGDLLLAISGSGNSPNILKAVSWANDHGLTTVGITGFSGGKLKTLGPPQPARGHRRHGDRRIAAPGRLPLDHRRLYRRFSAKAAVLQRRRDRLIACLNPGCSGIEIGGTKLQLGIGQGHGSMLGPRTPSRRPVPGRRGHSRPDPGRRSRRCSRRRISTSEQIEAVGIGFGGPVDAQNGRTQKSFQIDGLGRFPARGLDRRASGDSAGRPRKRRRYRRAGRSPASARASAIRRSST